MAPQKAASWWYLLPSRGVDVSRFATLLLRGHPARTAKTWYALGFSRRRVFACKMREREKPDKLHCSLDLDMRGRSRDWKHWASARRCLSSASPQSFGLLDSPCGLLCVNTLALPRLLLPCILFTHRDVCLPLDCDDDCVLEMLTRVSGIADTTLTVTAVAYYSLCAVTPFVLVDCRHTKKPRQFRHRACLEHKGAWATPYRQHPRTSKGDLHNHSRST